MPQLASKIRAKYPGQYDDMNDDDLEKAVLAKHPEYADLVKPVETPKSEPQLNVERAPLNTPKNPTAEKMYREDYKSWWGSEPNYNKQTEEKLSTPLTEAPTRLSEKISKWMNPDSYADNSPRSLASAFVESLGHMASGMTSPREIASNVLMSGTAAKVLGKGKLGSVADSISGNVRNELEEAKKIIAQHQLTHKGPNIQPGTEIEYAKALSNKSTEIPYQMSNTPQGNLGQIADNAANNVQYGPETKPFIKTRYNEQGKLTPINDLGEISTSNPIESNPINEGPIDFEHPNQSSTPNDIQPPVPNQQFPSSWQTLADSPKSKQQILNEEAIAKRREKYQSSQSNSGMINNESKGFSTSTNTPSIQPSSVPSQITNSNKKASQLASMANKPEVKEGIIRKALDFNRTLLTAYDLSGPGRQGLGLVTHPEFWTSMDDMFKSFGSKHGLETVLKSIEDDASGLFKRNIDTLGKEVPSYAEKSGLAVHDIPEEIFRGQGAKIAEKILPGVSHSNRAYTGYLAKLRADAFKRIVNDFTKNGHDIKNDIVMGRKIADFVNTATGRGNLGKFESVSKQLSDVMFAPKLMASRVQTYNNALNPFKLAQTDPLLRKEAIRSLLGIVGTGSLLSGLGKLAGAEVSINPMNSDFGKMKIGNTRIDPYGGFQQYAVGAAKLITGKSYSSVNGNMTDLTSGRYGRDNRADVATRFFTNKLAPVPSFIWSWMQNKEFDGTPFDAKKAILTRTVPIIMQDLNELYQEDPALLPLGIPALMGMGVQSYGR